jgi:hypothetical protein
MRASSADAGAMSWQKRITRARTRSNEGESDTVGQFDEVVAAFASDREVVYGGGKGFGSGALKVRGKIFAMISSKGQFVVKLPQSRVNELVKSGVGEFFDAGRGKPMKEWLAVTGKVKLWLKLAKEARKFVGLSYPESSRRRKR